MRLAAQGTVSLDIGKVAISGVTVDGMFILDSDPQGNGNVGDDAQDFKLSMGFKGSPSINIMGEITVSLHQLGLSDVTGALSSQWLSDTDFVFAARILEYDLTVSNLFKAIKPIPAVISDVMNVMMPFRLRTWELFIDNQEWGIKVMGGVGAKVSGNPLRFLDDIDIIPGVKTYSDIIKHIPGMSALSNLQAGFSIGGPMMGNGLPVKTSLFAGSGTVGLYFCGRDADCPAGGYKCFGVCAKIGCQAGAELHGLQCYAPCRRSWEKHFKGSCVPPCPYNRLEPYA
jgi:hypothetical protein